MMDENKNNDPDKILDAENSEGPITDKDQTQAYTAEEAKNESIIDSEESFDNEQNEEVVDAVVEEVGVDGLENEMDNEDITNESFIEPPQEIEHEVEINETQENNINPSNDDADSDTILEEEEEPISQHETNFQDAIDAGLVAGYVHNFNLNLGYSEDARDVDSFSRLKNRKQFNSTVNRESYESSSTNQSERFESRRFIDPTISLTKFPDKLHDSIKKEDLQKYTNVLREERIIVLTCLDDRIAFDTARSLAAQISDKNIEHRQLLGRQDKNENIHIDIFMYEKIGQGRDIVIVVDVKSPLFFGSMISSDYSNYTALKGLMEDKNIFLIFTISAESRIEDIKKSKFHFKVWDIPVIDDPNLYEDRANQIQKTIPEKENLSKIILYTITFFPGLNQEDFENIVLILLENINKSKKKKRKIKEEWFEQPDYYLNKCKVYKIYLENYDEEVIEFVNTRNRVFFKKHFNDSHSFYIRQKYEILLASGLLFDITTNTQITLNLIDLILKKLLGRTKEYAIKYLHELTMAIVDNSTLKIDKNASLAEFWNQLSDNFFIRKNAMAILAQLLDEMLSNSRLKEAVRGYLNFYMIHKRDIVQDLTSELRYSPNFNKFYWIGRLLDEGDTNTRDKSFTFLVSLSKQIGVRIFDFLEEIRQWLPDVNAETRSSNKSVYGLAFILHYTNEITNKFAIKNFGHYPSRYVLFTSLVGDEESISNKLELILSWLFHPALEGAIIELRKNHSDEKRINVKRENWEILRFKAYLIEVWFAILNWGSVNQEKEDSERLAFISDKLIEHFFHFAPEDVRLNIEKIWESKSWEYAKLSGTYLKKITKIKDLKSAHRKQLLDSRDVILKSFAIINRLRKKVKDNAIHNKIEIES